MSVRDLYEKNIRPLSPMDRLRLATLILEELTASQGAGLDVRDEWSDEDLHDLAAFSMKHGTRAAPSEELDG